MGGMKNLLNTIQEDILDGKLSFAEIAAKHEIPNWWVEEAANELRETDQYIMDNDYMDDG